MKSKDDSNYKMSQWHKDQHQNQLRIANNETEQYKMQFEQAMSLVETQKLSIKLFQDELLQERKQSSMPRRLHRCGAFDVNARHASIIMKIE